MPDPTVAAFADRLGTVIARAAAKLPADARQSLVELVSPQNLAIMAGVLVAWVIGHAFGIGELIDIVIAAVGVFSVGLAIFSGLDELFAFARGTYEAKTDKDFEAAADHLAKAITILGITAVLAILFKGAVKTGRTPVASPEPAVSGLRYQPKTVPTSQLGAGEGATSAWGDVELSTKGSETDRNLAMFHERVHQIITPKFFKLRRFRVEQRLGAYFQSSLYRYVEEALAETVAQVGVNGFSNFFVGLRFPVESQYVYLMRGGGYSSAMAGKGLLPEGAALLASGTMQGFAYRLYIKAGVPTGFRKPAVSTPKADAPMQPAPAILKGAFTRATGAGQR